MKLVFEFFSSIFSECSFGVFMILFITASVLTIAGIKYLFGWFSNR